MVGIYFAFFLLLTRVIYFQYELPTYVLSLTIISPEEPTSGVSDELPNSQPLPPSTPNSNVSNAVAEHNTPIAIFCCHRDNETLVVNETIVVIRPVATTESNWTSQSLEETFRKFSDPGQVNRSPCPCNLNVNSCDSLCCCDATCSEDEKRSFGCVGDHPSETALKALSPPYECADLMNGNELKYPTASYYNPFPHGWLCVMYKNTPYLGEYFADLDYNIISDKSFLKAYRQELPEQSYDWRLKFALNLYKQKHPLVKLASKAQDSYQAAPLTIATAPGRGPDGRCLRKVPLRFLENQKDVFCEVDFQNEATCESQLSSLSFQRSFSDIISGVNSSAFTIVTNNNCECEFSDTSHASATHTRSCSLSNDVICSNKPSDQPSNTPSSCSCSTSSSASMPANELSCQNPLKSGSIDFEWVGNKLRTQKLKVQIGVLASKAQRYEQKFSYSFKKSNEGIQTNIPQSSSWNWYKTGDNIMSQPVADPSQQSCDCLKPLQIKYGYSTYKSCPMEIAAEQFADCDKLRGLAIAALRKMIPMEKLAKIPNPSAQVVSLSPNMVNGQLVSSDWVDVVKLRRFPPELTSCSRVAVVPTQVGSTPTTSPNLVGRYPVTFRSFENDTQLAFATEDGRSGSPDPLTFCEPQNSRLKPSTRNGTVQTVVGFY